MYVVYLSKSIDVKQLAAIWGQPHHTIRNGELQSFHHILVQHDWLSLVKPHITNKSTRFIRINDCDETQLAALSFTGVMEDPEFQVIGYVSDENMEKLYSAHRDAMKMHVDLILETLRTDAHDAIDEMGVYDRIRIEARKRSVTFLPKEKTNFSDVFSLETADKNKKQLIANHIQTTYPDCASYLMLAGVHYGTGDV